MIDSDVGSDDRFVTETFGYDGGRRVTVYRPADPPELVLYAGDGQLISSWGPQLEGQGLPPTMIVGVHRTDAADEMLRITEYSPGFDPAVFAAHETFVVDEVRSWVKGRFGLSLSVERTAVVGVSAGAELSLALGLRHPDVFGAIYAASPGGGYRPPDALPDRLPRTYLTAGTLEPWFAENATRWADALRAAGADVVSTVRDGDHGDPFWADELAAMVRWTGSRT